MEKIEQQKETKEEREQKEELASLKTIAKGAGIVFIGMVIGKIIGYLYVMLVARLGTEQFGLLNLGFAVVALLSTIALLGLDYGIFRYIPFYSARKDKKRVKGALFSALFISFPLSILFAILLFIFSTQVATIFFHNILLAPLLRVFSFMIPLTVLGTIFLTSFKAFKRVEYEVTLREIAEKAIRLLLAFVFIFLGFSLSWIAFSYVAAAFIVMAVAFYILNKKIFKLFDKIKPIFYKKELLSYSLPLLFSGILIFVVVWTDTFMLGFFRTVSEVGIYNAAHPTAALMFLLPTAIISLFLPVITELFSKRKMNEIKDLFRKVSKWIFFVSFPIFLVMFFFSKHIINIIFGQDYVSGAIPLSILVFGYLIHSFAHTSGNILSMKKKTKQIFVITLIFGISNVVLNYFMIPLWGINGAAIATSISYVIGTFLYLLFNKIHGINIFFPVKIKPFLKSILAGIISITLVYYISNLVFEQVPFYGFVLMFIVFISLYFALLLMLKGFGEEDKEVIRMLFKRFNFVK